MREWTGKKKGSSKEVVEVSRLDVGTPPQKQGLGWPELPEGQLCRTQGLNVRGDGEAEGGQLQDFWPG